MAERKRGRRDLSPVLSTAIKRAGSRTCNQEVSMKKLLNALKLAGILICSVLFVVFLFIDIIDLFIPGDFPDWVTFAELTIWAVIGVFAIANFIKEKKE